MKYNTKLLFVLSLFLTGFIFPVSTPVSAQSTAGAQKIVERSDGRYETLEEHFMMHFHWDKTYFDPNYLTNGSELERLRAFIDGLDWNLVDRIEMYSYASPEGVYEHNLWLSRGRSNTMLKYITEHYPNMASKLTTDPRGESWEGLRDYVEADTYLSEASKTAIMKILDSDINVGTKKWRLERQADYKYLYKTYYPLLRNTGIMVVHFKRLPDPEPEPVPEPEPEPVIEPEPEPEPAPEIRAKETVLALKTNLLYDAVTALNFEVEVPIGRRYSLAVEDVFPWWEFKENKTAFQNWEMGVEGRYWFKSWTWNTQKLLGHFLGVYGMSGRGDLQFDDDPDKQWHYWSSGLTYGYVMPLGKKKHHWGNLEFSISAGYLRGKYQHYWPAEDYSELIRDPYKAGHANYIGPTKAKVSLVIPINIFTKRASAEANQKLKEAAYKE